MNYTKILSCSVFFLIMLSCTKLLSPKEYLRISNDLNGPFVENVSLGGYEFTCYYRSTDFYVAHYIEQSTEIKALDINSTREKYQKGTYFLLSIDAENKNPNKKLFSSNLGGYNSVELLFDVAPFFKLKNEHKLIDCSLATIERSWGHSKKVNILLMFPPIPPGEIKNYKLHIKEFGLKCGLVSIDLSKITPNKFALKF